MKLRSLIPMALVFVPTTLLGSPPEQFALEPSPVRVGGGWVMRTSTRVEEEPRLKGAQPKALDYAEASGEVRCKVLREAEGKIELETHRAEERVTIVTGGETTHETRPSRKITEWGAREELVGVAEVGPTSLLARKQTHVGDTWTAEAELLVGGVAPVTLRFVYKVTAKKEAGGRTLLRIVTQGQGQAEAGDGSIVSVRAKGVMTVDPSQADLPRKVVLVYRFAVTGGPGPDAATRTTIRMETESLGPKAKASAAPSLPTPAAGR